MLTFVSVIDEPVPTSEAPAEPFPVVVIVVPVTETLVSDPCVSTALAKTPAVESDPPFTVVEPPSRVRMACDSSPPVVIVELVSVVVPPTSDRTPLEFAPEVVIESPVSLVIPPFAV